MNVRKIDTNEFRKRKLEVVAYNEIADYCVRNLTRKETVIIYGKIIGNLVEIIDIETDNTI